MAVISAEPIWCIIEGGPLSQDSLRRVAGNPRNQSGKGEDKLEQVEAMSEGNRQAQECNQQ